jgi:hypothetical protein
VRIIENGCSDLYKLNDPLSPKEKADIHDRLRAVIGFINDAIDAKKREFKRQGCEGMMKRINGMTTITIESRS